MFYEHQKSDFISAVSGVENVVKAAFPIRSRQYELTASNWRWLNLGDAYINDVAKQKQAKLKEQTYAARLVADFELKSIADGKTVDSLKNYYVLDFPHLTRLGGYIVGGKDRQIVRQMRLRPGLYSTVAPDGTVRTMINTSAAGTYKVLLDRASGMCRLALSHTNIPIYSALRAVGATDAEIKAVLGPELFAINVREASVADDTHKMFVKLRPYESIPADLDEQRKIITKFMASKPLDAQVNAITTGQNGIDKIDKRALLAATDKAIRLSKGSVDEDDTESLAFKSIHGIDDFILEKYKRSLPTLVRYVQQALNKTIKSGKRPEIKFVMPPHVFSSPIESFFGTSELSRYSEQNNLVDIAATSDLITPMGEGGIKSIHAVTDDVRAFHPTYLGAIDPLETPEGQGIGLTNHLTMGVKKVKNRLAIDVYDAKTRKKESKLIEDLVNKVVAFPDQYSNLPETPAPSLRAAPKPKTTLVKARTAEGVREVQPKMVDYIFVDPHSFFSFTSMLVPFLPNNHPNRVLMGDKHMTQAVPLVGGEAPLVQHRVYGKGFDEVLGSQFLAHSPINGKVTKITNEAIFVKPSKGKAEKIPLYKDYPLNSKLFLTEAPLPDLKIGTKVKQGQPLTQNNFTSGKSLALGKNLKVAYTAWHGYNHEDGIVISETAAKKLTSEHKYEFRVEKKDNIQIGVRPFIAAFPKELAAVNPVTDYDESGIIKKGTKLKKNQVIIPAIRKAEYHPELDLHAIKKSSGVRWSNMSEVWDLDVPGEVVEVVNTGGFVKVFVKTKEPMVEGDKLCFAPEHELLTRAGWKVVADVTFDDEVATLNPTTHELEYQHPIRLDRYVIEDEQLYSLDMQQLSMRVTLDHKLYVAFGPAPAAQDFTLLPARNVLGRDAWFRVDHPNERGQSLVIVHTSATKARTEVYSGEVFCIEVPNNLVYTRRDGKPHWSGNSVKHGAKGIVTRILPDSEMPRGEDGKSIEVLLNPAGVPGRMNAGQMLETAASKVALKTGNTYWADNFNSKHESTLDKVKSDLAAHGISDHETLTIPRTGDKLNNVLTGYPLVMKLKHMVSGKISSRNTIGDSYSLNEQPTKGGDASAQRIGALDTFSLLSGDATNFLGDAFGIKSQKNHDYWLAIQSGKQPTPPKTPFVSEKFVAMLLGAGIDLNQKNNELRAMPMTDAEVRRLSHGAIKEPLGVRANDLSPERGGLFDPQVTGGPVGNRWAHIELASPVVNPLLLPAVASVGRFKTEKQLNQLLEGSLAVDDSGNVVKNGKYTGVEGVRKILESVDVNREIALSELEIKNKKGTERNKAFKRLRYLKALKETDISPAAAYIQTAIPVIPPKFRQLGALDDGTLSVDDANHGYREILLINKQIEELRNLKVKPELIRPLEVDLNKAVSGMVGITPPLSRPDHFRGFVDRIKGVTDNKQGFFQNNVLARPQDLSARSTITVNPKLHMDEVGIPKEIARRIYRPFIISRASTMLGLSPIKAKEMLDANDPYLDKVLELEMQSRPVLLNRAPSLHKYSMIAQKGRLIDGKAITLNPMVMAGLNADLDGDCQNGRVVIKLSEIGIRALKTALNSEKQFLHDHPLFGIVDADLDDLVDQFIDDRDVTARFKVATAIKHDDRIIVCDLSEFPHHPDATEISVGRQGNLIRWHKVPEGIEVLSFDQATGDMKWKPATWYTVHDNCEIYTVDLSSGQTIFTDDDPRAVYGISADSVDLVPRRFTPVEAKAAGASVPYSTEFATKAEEVYIDVEAVKSRSRYVTDRRKVTNEFCYAVGAMIGDGWIDSAGGTYLANIDQNVIDAVVYGLESVVDREIAVYEKPVSTGIHTPKGENRAVSLLHAGLGRTVAALIGQGAENKHLPEFAFKLPTEARLSLLAGLIDTDGCVALSKARSKAKVQTSVNYSTTSLRLAREIQMLCKTIGVRAGVTPTKTPSGRAAWAVSLETGRLQELGLHTYMKHTERRTRLATAHFEKSAVSARYDAVPFPMVVAAEIQAAVKGRDLTNKESLQTIISRAKGGHNSVSRAIAKQLLAAIDMDAATDLLKRWAAIVNNESVRWGLVTKVEKTGIMETGYDLSVPGYETFMSIDGVVLSNTVGLHVPVTEGARAEALEKLLPSQNFFSVRDNSPMHTPGKETIHGVYLMTKPLAGEPQKFSSEADALTAYKLTKIKVNSPIEVAGKATCVGRILFKNVLPPGTPYDGGTVTNNVLNSIYTHVGKNNSPAVTADTVTKIKDLGNHFITAETGGFSVSLKDLEIDKNFRDNLFKSFVGVKDKKKFAEVAQHVGKQLDDHLKTLTETNRFALAAVGSGALGKAGQLRQLILSPVAVSDHTGETVPVAIPKSYAEGHDIASYLNTTPGARKGLIDKGLSVADTGYGSRLIVNSNIEQRITIPDCGTTDGRIYALTDRNCADRYVADGPHKGEVVSDVARRQWIAAGEKEVKVRSPLTCKASGGVCQKCFGLDENGRLPRIGFHIGVLAGQTVGERATQLTLRAFHSGGAVGSAKVGFDRIKELIQLPQNLKGKAVLASVSGTVTSVVPAPAGGFYVTINQTRHFVPQEMGVNVSRGQRVSAGDPITSPVDSSGTHIIKPQELLEITGDIRRTQDYLLQELDKNYSGAIKHRIFETVLKPLTEKVKVTDVPAQAVSSGLSPGDVVNVNHVNDINKQLEAKGLPRVRFEHQLYGIKQAPLHSDDFVGALAHESLKKTLMAAPAVGLKARLKGGHPLTELTFKNFRSVDTVKKSGRT